MSVLLLLLCFLCFTPVFSIFDNVCPRKDPPPGVLVVSPGSRLELTCTGQVKVNGVKVFRRNRTFPNKIDKTSTVSERYHSPTTAGVKSDREDKEVKLKGEYKDEEGSRVARELKIRPRWKWNKQLVQTVDRDWGEIAFLSDGSSLSLSSVRRKDAGKYTCHHGGEETFGVKVIVADPPETPSIHCYKKSPSSKIRCEWRPQSPVIKQPECHLFLSKSPSHGKPENFDQIQCSYSSQRACCWCAVEHNEDELRTFHEAFLCVRSFLGNTTSPLIHFTPLDILKPDPPSNVSAHPVERLENTIMVTWKLPISWKDQDYFYDLTYEISYRPIISSNEQVYLIHALPDVDYLIQLRTKEEYDGQWSEWTSPVFARSWKAPFFITPSCTCNLNNFLWFSSLFAAGTTTEMCTSSDVLCKPQYHLLWISALFAVMSVLSAVYIFRLENLNY
uniref:Interleukin 6 receptor n=1 Tax=Fundulus heteroclitus TaxID=8078 RepID=A0A3Q2PVU9_FUNHE